MKEGRALVSLALVAILATACNAQPSSTLTRASSADAVEEPSVPKTGGSQDDAATSETESSFDEQLSTEEESSAAAADPKDAVNDGPEPVKLPWKSVVPVRAKLSTRCVKPGERLTLSIATKPEAAVAFQAVYADNKGGAEKPFGGGYGGNAKGAADKQGAYTNTWVVSLDAPAGPARVDVIVAWSDGEKANWGYDGPEFEVAGDTGDCAEGKG